MIKLDLHMFDYQNYLDYNLFGNSTEKYLYAIGIFLGLMIVFKIFRMVILGRLKSFAKSTKTGFDDELVLVLERIFPFFYNFIAFYIATTKYLVFSEKVDSFLYSLFVIVVVIQAIISFSDFVIYILRKTVFKASGHTIEENQTVFNGVQLIARIIIWVSGILLLLSNLGVNITSLAASLGVGGIAVALAVQNILSDVFSSFSIYFDKPFEIGDFITVGNHMGTVKKIGIKSTRLVSIQGEELVISNKELTTARIQNYKKMQKRRIPFDIGVVYETTSEKLKKIPDIITKIFSEVDNADLDRVNFRDFGAYSLNFEIVYFHLSGDYKEYMITREKLNLRIKEDFEKEGIDMAFPTQTLYVNK